MKGSFISVFLIVEFSALLNGFALRAQKGGKQMSVEKNNFSSFTRKYTNRGKLWMARNQAYQSHPDAKFGDQYSPNKKAVELFSKRTIDSKFYINKDTPSICYVQKSSSSMHFKKNGQWITIDQRLISKGQLLYEASNQEDPLGFDLKRKSSYIVTPDGRTYFNSWKLYGDKGGTEIWLASADWTHYTAGDDGIAIKNIFPGIDAEMKVSRGSIKTNFIVHANKFPSYKTLLFRDSFLSALPGNFSYSNGISENGLASAADFRVSARTVFHIKEGVMYQEKNPSSNYQLIPYYLDHNKLTLSINTEFLNAQLKVGNVIIDPLVQDRATLNRDQIKGSHSNLDCSLDTACEYTLNLPGLPGVTYLNASFSFGYTAFPPCVGQDAAFSFIINGECATQVWAGTLPGVGSEFFSNQNMSLNQGGSLAGCFPGQDKHDCDKPDNVPFNFYFFRKCHGPVGCDGSCIGAAQDLTITLVGRTFDSASVSASADNICPGTPVTLTARGYYGIPPYNFQWLGINQNNSDSDIQVNPLTNTVYTVQVSDACKKGNNSLTKLINVHVLPKPTKPSLISNSPVCAGAQLVLSVPNIPGTTYLIKNPASGLGGQFSGTAVFNNVTAAYGGTWTAVATDANGCSSDIASTNVVVNPLVSPSVQISSSATNICTGTQVNFTATATNTGNSLFYQWLLNGNKVGTNSPAYSSSSLLNNDAVSCVVFATVACATGPDTSNIIVMNVSNEITPTFDGIGPFCQNVTPPVLPSTSKEGIAGTWRPASVNTSNIGTRVYTFTPTSQQCSSPVSLNISIVSSLTPTFPTIPESICQNDPAPQLPAVSKEGVNGTWNPSAISTAMAGQATYTFTPAAGQCGVSAQINIVINPLPTLNMGPDITIAAGGNASLNVAVTGNIVTYQWSPGIGLSNPNIKNPVASPSSTTVYTLNIIDDNQCEASGKIKITVTAGTSKISVPNAFSPNGDGVNDTWIISNLSAFPGATVDVFNRYGQLVFHSDNNNKAWDGTSNGKPLPLATYYYIIDPKNNEKKISGSVTLFR